MPGFFSTGALGTMMELKCAEAYWNRQSADRTRCDWKKQFQEFQWSILLKPHNATNGMQHKFSGEHEWKRSAGLLLEPCKWIRASPAYILQENKHPTPWNVEFASSSFPVKKIPKEYHVNGQIEHSECTLTGRCDALRLWLRQHLQGRANKIAKAAINLHTQDLCLLFLNETFNINFSHKPAADVNSSWSAKDLSRWGERQAGLTAWFICVSSLEKLFQVETAILNPKTQQGHPASSEIHQEKQFERKIHEHSVSFTLDFCPQHKRTQHVPTCDFSHPAELSSLKI